MLIIFKIKKFTVLEAIVPTNHHLNVNVSTVYNILYTFFVL